MLCILSSSTDFSTFEIRQLNLNNTSLIYFIFHLEVKWLQKTFLTGTPAFLKGVSEHHPYKHILRRDYETPTSSLE